MFGMCSPEENQDPHDECRFEIHRLEARVKELEGGLNAIASVMCNDSDKAWKLNFCIKTAETLLKSPKVAEASPELAEAPPARRRAVLCLEVEYYPQRTDPQRIAATLDKALPRLITSMDEEHHCVTAPHGRFTLDS